MRSRFSAWDLEQGSWFNTNGMDPAILLVSSVMLLFGTGATEVRGPVSLEDLNISSPPYALGTVWYGLLVIEAAADDDLYLCNKAGVCS